MPLQIKGIFYQIDLSSAIHEVPGRTQWLMQKNDRYDLEMKQKAEILDYSAQINSTFYAQIIPPMIMR